MTRRRSWKDVGQPLFGEGWWEQDQRLFQDSLIRRSPARPQRRRQPRRPAHPGTLPGDYVQDALFLEDDLLPQQGADHEQVRPDGPAALGALAADPVRSDRGSGQLLLGPWETGRGPDRHSDAATGRRRPARGGIPGQGGPSGPGEAPGGGDRAGGDGPAGSGTGGIRRLDQPEVTPPEAAARPVTFHAATQADLAPSGAVSRV